MLPPQVQVIQMAKVKCNLAEHQGKSIKALCLNPACKESTILCSKCIIKGHLQCRDHMFELEDIPKQLTEFRQLQLAVVALQDKINNQFKELLSRIEQFLQPISKYQESPNLTNLDGVGLLLRKLPKQSILQSLDESKIKIMNLFDKQNRQIPVGISQIITNKWDKNRMGTGITITENDTKIFLKEQNYIFRTAVAANGFVGGINYWEIEADDRTEKELKIGVTTNRDFNYNTAFCDFEYGWAYYGLGQLRHNSNATGPDFGKNFKLEGVLGMCLNMNTGTLKVSLNGELMGQAYQDEKLKVGPIYPAVSLLHCAGCKIIGGKPVPAIFQ